MQWSYIEKMIRLNSFVGSLYLNRQDIVLLESREIPASTFLRLQNTYHLSLIHSLLYTNCALELLEEKVLRIFSLGRISQEFDLIDEEFFKKLTIACVSNVVREIITRTRIHIDSRFGRNMFGVVDEYAVLEYGEVFVQYSVVQQDRIKEGERKTTFHVLTGPVVLTKNPCHHPGDLRIFQAVVRPELYTMVDVIVFPQKGPRPHSNEISGSDLDGNEKENKGIFLFDDLLI